MGPLNSPTPSAGRADWTTRLALIGRPHDRVHGLDDHLLLRRILGSATMLWGGGFVAFLAALARLETVTIPAIAVYLALGPVLGLGYFVASRAERMPGFVLLAVILWTSLLGTVSEFYFAVAPITTVALCTAFVSWLGTRVAPLYAIATVLGLLCAGAVQHDPWLVNRTIVVALATAFAVSIVGRSSDSSRTSHDDREVLLHRLAHESRHDELTGLGNRKLLIERTLLTIESSSMSTVALALIDLDGFKAINDTHGHMVGDGVLRAVASRLRDAVDSDDTVVRIGGDEFAVLFSAGEIDRGDALTLLKSIFGEDLVIDDVTIPIRASIGVAVHDRGATALEDLLAAADDAMYVEKRGQRAGRGETVVIQDS